MNARGPFDAIHVISDLHWGDTARRRIFREEDRLARWIQSLAGTPGAVALVLNGDIFDFIASYPEGCYVDPADAVQQVDAILGADGPRAQGPDALFPLTGITAALRAFVNADRHHLVLVIGNHDVELAFPEVLDRVLHWICDHGAADAAERALRRARVETRLNGEGWSGSVGPHEGVVYCVHGNAADPVNVVDHEGLRRIAARVNRGELALSDVRRHPDGLYDAPWGTRFVVDAMNAAKKQHPFVDLLKPEGVTLAMLLGHLDPALVGDRLDELFATLPTLARHVARGGVLSGSPPPPARGARRRPGPGAAVPRAVPRQRLGVDDIERLEELAERNVDPVDLVAQGTLGFFSDVRDAWTGWRRDRSERALWRAVRTTTAQARHRTLQDTTGDEVFDEFNPHIGRGVPVFVAGHTHAPRLKDLATGGVYANSGTWIELLRFPPEVFDTDDWSRARDGFRDFLRALDGQRIDDLAPHRDSALIGTAVSVTPVAGRRALRCELHRPLGAALANNDPLPLSREVELP